MCKRDHRFCIRRGCRLVGVDPKTVRRERAPDHRDIRVRMREIAAERRRFCIRRIGLMLEREGTTLNHKKLRRLYAEEGLAVKRRRFRVPAVIDGFTRECQVLVADTSLSGQRVARELDRIIRLYGKPATIVSDNGSELTSRAIPEWQNATGVTWHYICAGQAATFSECKSDTEILWSQRP